MCRLEEDWFGRNGLLITCVGGRDKATNTGYQQTNPTKSVFFQPAHTSATNIEWLLPEAVLTQFISPDDGHDVLETCREL